MKCILVLGLFLYSPLCALGGELTFELSDNDKMCFYEVIEKGVKTNLEFQVVEGGNFDCDLEVKSPGGQSLYKDIKKQYDSFAWTTLVSGTYEFCFSNEFSTFSHKVIYFDFQVGEEKPLKPGMEHVAAMTMMETAAVNVHESLKTIADYQTHHRLRETQGRSFAESLNGLVLYRSGVEFLFILITAIIQVITVRKFFSDKKTRGAT